MSNTIPPELKSGEHFQSRFCLRAAVEGKKGNGPALRMTLHDGHQVRPAIKWKITAEERQRIMASPFLRVTGPVQWEGEHEGQVEVKTFEEADEPDDITAYLPLLHEDNKTHQTRFRSLIASVQEPYLRQLLESVFAEDRGVWPDFCEAVAAEKMHHPYRGGLLHHTIEVVELCAAACTVIPTLNRDLLVACALLHDIGKLEEIEHGLFAGEYTDAGILSGHITAGVLMLRPYMNVKNIPGFPATLRETVTHMILSHHGIHEFGSPQLPAFPEAYVLAQADIISARVFQYTRSIQEARGEKKVYLPGKDGVRVFTGDLGLQTPPEAPAVPEPARTFQTAPLRRAEPLPSFATVRLPVRGLAAAGTPEQSSDIEEDAHTATLPAGTADFLVRVTGDSMVDAGIDEGDLLLIKSAKTADDGDLVLAHLGTRGEVVKRLRYAGTVGSLHSENRAQNYPPLLTDADTLIQGRVVGTLKGQ